MKKEKKEKRKMSETAISTRAKNTQLFFLNLNNKIIVYFPIKIYLIINSRVK